MRVTYLGNCSGATGRFAATNLLVDLPDRTVLVDAGPGAVSRIYDLGRSVTEIDTVVVTHSHGDHTLGVPYVLFRQFAERLGGAAGPDEIDLVTTPALAEGIEAMWSFCYPPGEYEAFDVVHRPIDADAPDEVDLGRTRLRTTPVDHAVPTVGLRFDAPGGSFSHSADTVYDERFVDLAAGSDLCSHEAMGPDAMADLLANVRHGTAREAGRAAADAAVGRLLLHHLHPDYRLDYGSLLDQAGDAYDGPIEVPAAGAQFAVGE